MDRRCEMCGEDLTGRSSRARFCSSRCRGLARRNPDRRKVVVDITSAHGEPMDPAADLAISSALAAAMTRQQRSSVMGALAMHLALVVDGSSPESAGFASTVREFRMTLDALGLARPKRDEQTGGKVAQFRARRAKASAS